MKFTQKTPCAQCPYTCSLPGYIGGHDTPEDFETVVRADTPFPCHMSTEARGETCEQAVLPESKSQHCVGYMLYMNRMIKSSRRPEVSKRQRELADLNHLVVDPWKREVITIHQAAIENGLVGMKRKA